MNRTPTHPELTDLADFDLCQKAAAGNKNAFEEIYNRHHRRVYAIALKMTRNQEKAEDLTQDVFIQLFKKIGSFEGRSAFTTWLHRLTVNQVLMQFRKEKTRRTSKFASDEEDLEKQAEISGYSVAPESVPERIDIESAMKELPKGYLNVFILHDIRGFEHQEVARIMGISTGTSKSQLHKARCKLRRLLSKKSFKNQVWV